MSGPRTSKLSRRKSHQISHTRRPRKEPDVPVDDHLIRILVLDDEHETLERLENALWVWPHKVANANSVDEAVEMCRDLEPTALIVGAEFAGGPNGSTITTLRENLPQVPIVVLGSWSDKETPANIFDQGANAILPSEELHRPTLYDLLLRIQRAPESARALDIPRLPEMPLPYRESRIIGALMCEISGTIIDANDCLARWLGHSNADALIGKCVWRDVLDSQADWTAWTRIAGDMAALLYQSTTVKANNKELLPMKLEVFAAPSFPSQLQAVFVDQTELTVLNGGARDN